MTNYLLSLKQLWRFLCLLLFVVVAEFLDYYIYPSASFMPLLCVAGLLILSLTVDLTMLVVSFLLFFVAVYVALRFSFSYQPADP
ncbi:MAG: hypothetical protein WCH98_07410 [Verrucomicrobiota bacterium]